MAQPSEGKVEGRINTITDAATIASASWKVLVLSRDDVIKRAVVTVQQIMAADIGVSDYVVGTPRQFSDDGLSRYADVQLLAVHKVEPPAIDRRGGGYMRIGEFWNFAPEMR